MDYLTLVFVGLFAAVIGSFFNMLIYRVPREMDITFKRSHCPSCETPLKAGHLIPILSYIFQLGRCGHCKAKIPIRYFLTELITIIGSVWIVSQFGWTVLGFKIGLFFLVMVLLFFIDYETQLLPDIFTLPLIVIGHIFAWFQGNSLDALYGMCVGFGIYFIISSLAKLYYKQDAMGGGDVKLAAAIGAFWGLKLTVIATYLGFLIGGTLGMTLILLKLKTRKDNIPFGPSMILGVLAAGFWHQEIWALFVR